MKSLIWRMHHHVYFCSGWHAVLNCWGFFYLFFWPHKAYCLIFSIQKNNGLEGEVVCREEENREKRAVRRGSRPCSHEPWIELGGGGGLKEELFSIRRYCLEKGRTRWKEKKKTATKGATSMSKWRLFLPLLGFSPGKWAWRRDCQHHTDKVTVGHTLLSLPSLCGCCCVLFLFFFPPLSTFYLSLSLLLSPLCLHLSLCSLYLVAKAFQAASSSLGILEAQQSPHTYTHTLKKHIHRPNVQQGFG